MNRKRKAKGKKKKEKGKGKEARKWVAAARSRGRTSSSRSALLNPRSFAICLISGASFSSSMVGGHAVEEETEAGKCAVCVPAVKASVFCFFWGAAPLSPRLCAVAPSGKRNAGHAARARENLPAGWVRACKRATEQGRG